MYSLLKACYNKLEIIPFTDACLLGLSDDYDIQIQTFLIIIRLTAIDFEALVPFLPSVVDKFRAILTKVLLMWHMNVVAPNQGTVDVAHECCCS